MLAKDETPQEAERLISELSNYQDEARVLERNVLYRYAVRQKESFVNQEIRTIMTEFGAETYSVPPEFEQGVNQHIEQYRGPDRPLMERALNDASSKLTLVRQMLEAEKLPPDLAFIPLVESALLANQASAAGAAGPWQLTTGTARALGLAGGRGSGRAAGSAQGDAGGVPLPAQPDPGLWGGQFRDAGAGGVQPGSDAGEAGDYEGGGPDQAAQFLVSVPGARVAGGDARICSQGVCRDHHWTQSGSVRVLGGARLTVQRRDAENAEETQRRQDRLLLLCVFLRVLCVSALNTGYREFKTLIAL